MQTRSEALFVKRIYRFSATRFRGRKAHPEFVEVSAQRIAIIDTHPDQPGRVLAEFTLNPDGSLDKMRWQSIGFPFLDLQGYRHEVERAVKGLLRAQKRELVAKGVA